PDLRYWADENWQNDPGFRRVDCARQRRFVARVCDCCRDRCQSLAAGNQPVVFLVLAEFGGVHSDLAVLRADVFLAIGATAHGSPSGAVAAVNRVSIRASRVLLSPVGSPAAEATR